MDFIILSMETDCAVFAPSNVLIKNVSYITCDHECMSGPTDDSEIQRVAAILLRYSHHKDFHLLTVQYN